jgi:hypothetical protein
MKNSCKLLRLCGLATCLLTALSVVSLPAYAVTLVPVPLADGGTDTTFNDGTLTGGSVIADTGVETITSMGSGLFYGSFDEQVYKTSGGTLDFLYQFAITSPTQSGEGVELLGMNNFTGFTTSVGTDSALNLLAGDTGTVAPTAITRSGGTVNFAYDPLVGPGKVIDTVVIVTNATSYAGIPLGISFQDGGVALVNGLTPAPEPALDGLLLSAFLGAGVLVVRRVRMSQV